MFRTALAAVLILAGASAASAQGYGHYNHVGPSYQGHGRVIVVPPRPFMAPPHRHRWHGWNRFHRYHPPFRHYGW